MVHFPILKLGILGAKHISNPINKAIRRIASTNSMFRSYVVIPPAQFYHWVRVRAKVRVLGLKQPKYVTPLNPRLALETGSDLLAEMIIFSICCALLIIEFSRQAKNDRIKHERHAAQRQDLQNQIKLITDRVQQQSNEIKNLKYRANLL